MVLAEDLRQAVLQAALQGKLTGQLDTDSDVDKMLISIQEKKEKLIADKKIKKEKLLPEIQDEEIPFDIPDNWCWIKIGEIVDIKNGFTPKRTDETLWNPKEIPWFTVEDIHEQGLNIYHTIQSISKKALGKTNSRIIPAHTVLLCCTSATIGKYAMAEIDLTTNQQWNGLVIKEEQKHIACSDYILVWVSSLKKKMTEIAKSTTFPFLSIDKLSNFVIPLPPIEEQQRIVDKINEIMPKIDEYEKIEKELEALKKEFPTNIKNALLQAAMQGKLTEQLESDSSVDELLASIQKEKEELIAQKKIKKEKFLLDITEEEIPFDIPENWRWVKLGNVGTLTRGSGIKRNEVTETGYPCIRYGELYTTYKIKFDVAVSHTSKEMFDRSQKVNKNDILMALTGENNFDIALALAYVGDETVAMGGDLTRWSNHHMNPLYLVYAMNSSYAIHKKSEMAKGDIIVHISNDKLSTILLPIPPIEEQNRIVEKLDTLLPLCEDLKE